MDSIITALFSGFLASLLTFIYTSRKDKKETFIKTVTEARKEFLQQSRDLIAEFCYLVTANPKSPKTNKIKYHLLMHLYPGDYPDWDEKIADLMELLINPTPGLNFDKTLAEFIIRCQYNLKIEWQGLTLEGRKGRLTNDKKEELRKVMLIKCEKYLKKKGIINQNNMKNINNNNNKLRKTLFFIGIGLIFFAFQLLGWGTGIILAANCSEMNIYSVLIISAGIALLVVGRILLKYYRYFRTFDQDYL